MSRSSELRALSIDCTNPPPEPGYQRVDHLLHLWLCVPTLGLWTLVWWSWALYVAHRNQRKRTEYLRRLARYQRVQRDRRRVAAHARANRHRVGRGGHPGVSTP